MFICIKRGGERGKKKANQRKGVSHEQKLEWRRRKGEKKKDITATMKNAYGGWKKKGGKKAIPKAICDTACGQI